MQAMPEPARAVAATLGWLIAIPGCVIQGRGLLTLAFIVAFWSVLGAFVLTRRGRATRESKGSTE